MPTIRRGSKAVPQVAPEDVIWGVPRREAASDQDDPLVHAGVIQHAFLIGVDYEAICGFKPPLRSGFVAGTKSPQLALPGRDNPRCPKCSARITSVGTLEEEVQAALAQTTTTDEDLIEGESTDGLANGAAADEEESIDSADDADGDVEESTEDEMLDEAAAYTDEDEASVNARDSAWAP